MSMFKQIFEGCWFHSSLDISIFVFKVSSNWRFVCSTNSPYTNIQSGAQEILERVLEGASQSVTS